LEYLSRGTGTGFGVNIPQAKKFFKRNVNPAPLKHYLVSVAQRCRDGNCRRWDSTLERDLPDKDDGILRAKNYVWRGTKEG
jgi:hypothetical protein